jgi:molybdopterin adenylyltransferase
MTAAVFTVSDSSHAGTRHDASGPAVRARLEELGWTVSGEIIPDDADWIARRLAETADKGEVAVIFTTGGTGVALRDVTPEATKSVIEREIPGIGEWMRINGRSSTKMSILSRGVAGTRGRTLIVNLPGSPRGAVESLNAIMDVVPHVIDLLSGNTEHRVERKL